ncbi:MAG: amino-acid N-acetyltransferase [Candidatus Xiphinematobacter sp.]|nr:MAG: amino-acid N-acetyltransferase [Candidatus Xiphinematobacter sp.]QQY11059.1 MAG: amino-acid N-acetyltransferase [Candidatus Xiphinematobacter sp.]
MNVAFLREILQYIPQFWERIFVISVDGSVAGSENFSNILLDLAVLRSLSIKVILVHGASVQTERLASKYKVKLSSSSGIGVTDVASLQVSIDAAMRLTSEIMQGLSAVDLRVAYVNAIIAHSAGILGGKDYQFTGRVERVDSKVLDLLLREDIIPILPPLGFDGEGHTYRVNSDAIAVEVAGELQAAKVIFLASAAAFEPKVQLPKQISASESEELVIRHQTYWPSNLISKLDSASRACRQGISRVHILNGGVNGALLKEVFSNEGFGTMVHSDEYQQVRGIFKKDVWGILNLIRQSVKNEELVRRTRGEILAHMEDYWVLDINHSLVACVALHVYPEEVVGEMACLYVHSSHENKGYGRKLMAFIETLAKEKGLKKIYALSTQAFNYLQQKGGFRVAQAEDLPVSRREKYEASGRCSRILVKELTY